MNLLKDENRTPLKGGNAIALIIACAVGAIVFTGVGGWLVYQNTADLIGTRQWMEHTHQVLTSLQGESQRLDRISYSMQLYGVTSEPRELRAAVAAVEAMQVGTINLKSLVEDNVVQMGHLQDVQASIQQLRQELEATGTARVLPESAIQRLHTAISVMQDEEQRLLRERTDESRKVGVRSLISGGSYLGFSLLVVTGLFGFLVRDALQHRNYEKQVSLANDQLAATIEQLERRGGEDKLLKDARDELQLCVTPKEAQACACRHLEALVPGSNGATFIINHSRSMLEMTASWNTPDALADGFELTACCGLRAGRSRWRRAGHSELNCTHFNNAAPEDYLCVPLAAHGDTLGFVFLSFPTETISGIACGRIKLIHEMVELASMAIAGLNLRMKLENQSIRDGLTNLFNRHFMEIALERELHRAARRNVPLAVLMLDVDMFKELNDRHGHQAGDEVLRGVAECFRQSVRTEDIICRYGGEEFAIILPEITQEFALARAEAIRQTVNRMKVEVKGQILTQVTISIGVAMYPVQARNATDLLKMADGALYEAKRAGRNRTMLANDKTSTGLDEELALAISTNEPVEA